PSSLRNFFDVLLRPVDGSRGIRRRLQAPVRRRNVSSICIYLGYLIRDPRWAVHAPCTPLVGPHLRSRSFSTYASCVLLRCVPSSSCTQLGRWLGSAHLGSCRRFHRLLATRRCSLG